MSSSTRIGPARRGLSALLATLYVALSGAAGLHVGDHDASALEWLPLEYHHHGFELADPDAGADPDGQTSPCVACQLSRLVLKLDPPVPRLAPAQPAVGATTLADAADPRSLQRSPLTARGPPSA